MKTSATCQPWSDRPLRRFWAVLGLGLFLALQVFASSGELHRTIHSDAGSPSHHCPITLLTGGQVNAPILPALWMALAAALLFFLPPLSAAAPAPFNYRFSASRAPPRF